MGCHGSDIKKFQQDMKTALKRRCLKRPGEGKREGREERLDKRLKLESEPPTPGNQQNKQKMPAGMGYSLTGVTLGTVVKRPTLEHKRRLGILGGHGQSGSRWKQL
jgi:hypothetical protein